MALHKTHPEFFQQEEDREDSVRSFIFLNLCEERDHPKLLTFPQSFKLYAGEVGEG